MSYESQQYYERFSNALNVVKPALFQLVGKLATAYPERQWNVMFVEDTGCRLPAHFIRGALRSQGIKLPIYFLGASRAQRKIVPKEAYTHFVREKSDTHGIARAVVLTENIGLGLGIRFMHEVVSTHFEEVDVATVVSRDGHHKGVADHVFMGAEGNVMANNAVIAFEEVERAGNGWTNTPLTGIVANTAGDSPHAAVSRAVDRDLINSCYGLMNRLVGEYLTDAAHI